MSYNINKLNTPCCMVCHSKNAPVNKINNLKRLLDFLQSRVKITPTNNKNENVLIWDISERCKYGLHCPDLARYESEMKHLTKTIDPYIQAIIENGNVDAYHQVLQFLRGDFSRTYKMVERDWHKKLNEHNS